MNYMKKEKRFTLPIAAFLILKKDDQILLIKRHNTGFMDGYYTFVAGHMDGAETPAQCIVREAKEEANIVLTKKNLKVVHIMHVLSNGEEYINFYLEATKWEGDITNMEPHKCSEIEWYDINNLPENFIPKDKIAFENSQIGNFYSELGFSK